MDKEFDKAFEQLNQWQKKAVTSIDGPLLVIAGPGTGKTQLLGTRVGYILKHTDTLPQNILCLTFTEAGVETMRERIERFLGQEAYDVHISTYHAFGSDLLRRYPEYGDNYGAEPIDELSSDSIIREVLAGLSYDNPVKSADAYAGDLKAFISEAKRALLSPKDLSAIAKNNLEFVHGSAAAIKETLAGMKRVNKNSLVEFELLRDQLKKIGAKKSSGIASLKELAVGELTYALGAASQKNTKPISAWKNKWLAKDTDGAFILSGERPNQKIVAATGVYASYQKELSRHRAYDFDDMILRTIKALQTYPDFKFTLAEQYQYILLDEFQDTNPAQFKIVELLTDNPVNEGRPNVMAVGDDDQAIYAFQGADHANMLRFSRIYKNVQVISLRQNYRSHREILDVAYNISGQIKNRLHKEFEGLTKILKEASPYLPDRADVAHFEFISDAAQYAWVARQVKRLVTKEKIKPQDIAILAPKHRYLIPVLPYLSEHGLAVRYEKRENILDKPLVRMLTRISALVIAIDDGNPSRIDEIWPEVLSYDCWELPTDLIWKISQQAYKDKKNWTGILLGEAKTKVIARFFLRAKDLLTTTTLEQQLDILTGVSRDDVKEFNLPMRSPFFEFYFGSRRVKDALYLEHLSDLSVLRGRLRSWRRQEETPFSLKDFNDFIELHRASDINILNTSPHYESKSAVNVMTAYQAKGREFKAVFIIAASDQVWGAASREANPNISLPPNLNFIRYLGASDDERLRLLYVALTRAKTHLYLTSYKSTADGKHMQTLKYLVGQQGLEPISAKPANFIPTADDMQNYWHLRHLRPFDPKLADLLEPALARYQLSPTHLNQFVDVINGGPEQFFLNTILRFPKGQSVNAQFGTAVHETIKWLNDLGAKNTKTPSEGRTLAFFSQRLTLQRLAPREYDLLQKRGSKVLTAYLRTWGDDFNPNAKHEVNFRNEGVFCKQARLTGKIDKLILNKKAKTVTVIDYKTGKGYDRWQSGAVKLHKYRQQLLAYKLLVEGSHSYAGHRVERGILEFIEPDQDGKIQRLELIFDKDELERFKSLLEAMWSRVMALNFPDTTPYPKNIKGILAFEEDLLKQRI